MDSLNAIKDDLRSVGADPDIVKAANHFDKALDDIDKQQQIRAFIIISIHSDHIESKLRSVSTHYCCDDELSANVLGVTLIKKLLSNTP